MAIFKKFGPFPDFLTLEFFVACPNASKVKQKNVGIARLVVCKMVNFFGQIPKTHFKRFFQKKQQI